MVSESLRPRSRKVKILATLGPASSTPDMVRKLMQSGADAFRINMSHGDQAQKVELVQAIRALEKELKRPTTILFDLQGPKLRVGNFKGGSADLVKGDQLVLDRDEGLGNAGRVELPHPELFESVGVGDRVLIDDGRVRLKVLEAEDRRIVTEVQVGGRVSDHKGVNVPGVPLPVPSLTDKDLEDLDFALGLGVDYVAQSFVRSRADVAALRAKLETAGSQAWVIAKIELQEAVAAIEEILDEADAVMIARGDLGVEVGAADVPLLQKRIILAALERGKPAITATQMLESMVHRPEPTRAEASDVANAILDGTSAVMLSAETAIGEYPVEAVETMAVIALAVEPSLGYRHQLPGAAEAPTVGRAMSNAACDLAEALGAKAILVPTFTGRTASAVARLRPRRPVVALTHVVTSLQHMAIEWGVTPLEIPESTDVDDLWRQSIDAAREAGIVDAGDRAVLTAGTAVNIPGSTNVIKVDTA